MRTPPIQQKESAGQHDAHEGQEQEGKTLSPPAFQLMASDGAEAPPAQLKANSGGLPGDMVNGFAASTGHDLSDVKVHTNSDKPSQVGALAYAQGNDIHLGAGQEKHLAHEAAHIVQQREGRVKPTTEVNGKPVNDNAGLESEADSMGAKAMQMKAAAPAVQLKKQQVSGAIQRMQAVYQLQPKPVVSNPKLVNIVNALFKGAPAGGATIGDGSALAACNQEVGGGEKVGGRDHVGKCRDLLRAVNALLGKHENSDSPVTLDASDLAAANRLKNDLTDALAGRYVG